jgi:hypothetical protein
MSGPLRAIWNCEVLRRHSPAIRAPRAATAGLRAELRQRLFHADVHDIPQWETFEVTGPTEFTDLRGRTWYEYRATVESRRPFDVATTVTPPRHVPTERG